MPSIKILKLWVTPFLALLVGCGKPLATEQTKNFSNATSQTTPVDPPASSGGGNVVTPTKGSYSGTQESTSGEISLNASGLQAGQGSYISTAVAATGSGGWRNFAWTPLRPYGKELPTTNESNYLEGNAKMDGLMALLHFNEPTGATSFGDASTRRANATCTACPTAGIGAKFNSGVTFSGAQNLSMGTTASLEGPVPFSVSGWIRTTGDTGVIIQQRDDANPGSGTNGYFQFLMGPQSQGNFTNPPGTLVFWTQGDGTGANGTLRVITTNPINDGKWHHVAAVREVQGTQATGKIYVDGVAVANSTVNTVDALHSNVSVYLGYDQKGNRNYFSGSLDEFALFSRSLSAQEVMDQYQRGVLRLKFQLQTCATATSCNDQNFVGPDGTSTSFYSELLNQQATPPSLPISSLSLNPYLKYKLYMETDVPTLSPKVEISKIKPTN